MRAMMPCLLLSFLLLLHLDNAQSRNIYGITDYGQRTVSDRLQSLGRAVDADKDTNISAKELANWARTLGRPDDDDSPDEKELSCVEQTEFEAGLQKAGFSEDFAKSYTDFLSEHSVTPKPDGCEGLDTQAVLDGAGSIDDEPVSQFLGVFLEKLIAFCEDEDAEGDLYASNKDCRTLPTACATAPYGCESMCIEYTFATTATKTGIAFSERAQHQAADSASSSAPKDFSEKVLSMFKDTDSNGVFSADEQKADFSDNFDTNGDDCVDEAEYKARMSTSLCGGFAFSDAYTAAKFEGVKEDGSDSCNGFPTELDTREDESRADFINSNVQALIDLCEGDATSEDCKQLSLTCRVDETTKDTDACKAYIAAQDSRDDRDPTQNTAIKFFRFLSKWGWTYDEVFGDKD